MGRNYIVTVLLLFMVGTPSFSSAAEERLPDDNTKEPGFIGAILDGVDQQHESLSEYVVGFSETIDTFFVSDDQERQLNYSHLQLGYRYTYYRAKDGGSQFEPIIDARIHLPRTKNRLTLEVSTSDNEGGGDATAETGAVTTEPSSTLGLGLGYLGDLAGLFTTKVRGGAKLVGSTVNFYTSLRLYRKLYFEEWTVQLSEKLYKDSIVKKLATTELQFERRVTATKLFRAISQNRYYFDLGYSLNSQTFYMMHQLSDREAIIYQVGAGWKRLLEEQDNRLESYYNLVRYSRKVYKDWLYFSISPQIQFLEENDFVPIPLLTMQLTAFLGNKK
ncbi:MAG: hypothetical protein GQ470_03325 [Gammaproteobacteria bacterium]|nr:hypothetical protein [Gammaproteobacteria bacterium]